MASLYTPEQTATMVSEYTANPTADTVSALAEKMGRSIKSIIAKLAREKCYKPKTTEKTGETVNRKNETAAAIGAVLKMSEGEVESMSKANKTALDKVWKALCESVPMTPENEGGSK